MACSPRTTQQQGQIQSTLKTLPQQFDLSRVLVPLINQARSQGKRCGWTRSRKADPLAWNAKLAAAAQNHASDMAHHNYLSSKGRNGTDARTRIRKQGYAFFKSAQIVSGGCMRVQDCLQRWLESKENCKTLLDPDFTEIGAGCSYKPQSKYRYYWVLMLGRPADQSMIQCRSTAVIQHQMIQFVNTARSKSRRCGRNHCKKAPPVTWNKKLQQVALIHAKDMAQRNQVGHDGTDGSNAGIRVLRQGYKYRHVAENLSAGFYTVEAAVQSWIDSPGHCKNLMNPNFTEIGAACFRNMESDSDMYWTLVLAKPR